LSERITISTRARLLALLAPLLLAATSCTADDSRSSTQSLSGRLGEHHGLPVLELWGTPEQAGYAQGYLLAEQIIEMLDGFMLDPKIMADPAVYENVLLPAVRRQFSWPPAYEAELSAIARGMRDRLGPEKLRSAILDRPLQLEDLMAANALADWFGMMCSTFSAWGPLTADGRTLTARNLDFPNTTSMSRGQIVIIRHAHEKTPAWIGVAWPATIGAYTAMNASGVTMLIHDANGMAPSEVLGFTPRSLTLRTALESATAENYPGDVQRVLASHRVLIGNNIHVSGPRAADRQPAVVFEYDANTKDHGVTARTAAGDTDVLESGLWCTNHLRLRRTPRECWRYDRLRQGLRRVADGGEKLTPQSALALIRDVRQEITLHSVCLVPDRKIMYVLIPAISENVVEFDLDEWLKRPKNR